MRVTINHVEKTSGFLKKTTYYVVVCRVDFTEEEKHIIKERKLGWTVVLPRPKPCNEKPDEYRDENFYNLIIGTLNSSDKFPDEYALATPSEAKEYEHRLTEALKVTKEFIMNNAEIEQKATTFEL